jgi:hypothetical protein
VALPPRGPPDPVPWLCLRVALPTLSSVQPAAGPSSGGDLVRLVGTDLADRVQVLFGGVLAEVLSVRDEAGLRVVDLRTPLHAVGVVDVELQNLDAAGAPVPGESVALAGAYRFARPRSPARPTSPASSASSCAS